MATIRRVTRTGTVALGLIFTKAGKKFSADVCLHIGAKAKISKTGNRETDVYNRGLYARQVVTRTILL